MSRFSNIFVASALCGTLTLPAFAQETAENLESLPAETAETPAPVSAAPAIPEIVVTAQKRAENLYEVPLSVSAIGRDALAERNVEKLDDIGQLTPNVDIAALPRSTYVRIRGLGSGDNKGFEQSIGLFVDGIYQGRAEYLNDAMLDIEQIEVLRGPQGTLFGKNTVAGALNITTANPGDDFEVWGSALMGEFSQMRLQGAVNAPVIEDAVNVRLAGKRNLRDGFIYNRTLNRDEANIDKYYFRGKVALVAIENLEVIAGFDLSKIKGRGNGYQLSALAEPATTLYTTFDPDVETDITDFETSLDYPGFVKRDTQAATLTANWELGEHTLTLVGGWSSYTFEVSDDVDFGPAPLLSFLYDDEYDQYSAELRIVSPAKRLSYVAGAYWFR
ncbi:MAG: TonB-dependent receptor, partial [Alphaproteobacteria bacterium]